MLAFSLIRETAQFLLDVERTAAALTQGTAITASVLDHFTLGTVLTRWSDVARESVRTALHWLGIADDPDRAMIERPYLGKMYERMLAADMPTAAYTSARIALAEAARNQWSAHRTSLALAHALDLTTGTVAETVDGITVTGVSWDALTWRIARTEATAVHNFATLDALARDGHTYKRWVAHHDNLTRDTHLAADGQTVTLASPFIVGNEALMVPGDPAGSPAVSYNCRCVIVGIDTP